MKKKEHKSALAAAVDVLEDELRELERLTDESLARPLNSEKHILQTTSSLQGIGGVEGRVRAAMAELATALGALGQRQQDRITKAAARAEELRARHGVFTALMQSYAALGVSVTELQAKLASLGEGTQEALPSIVLDVASLLAEAEALEARAKSDDFVDVGRHATSLRQQLGSLHASLSRRAVR